jgi:thiamine biosynthesis protein ThiS
MKVCINGSWKEIRSVRTIAELLELLRIPCSSALIEQNGNVIARHEFRTAAVSEGDALEIVQMVAGG